MLHALPTWGLRVNPEQTRRCSGIDELLAYHEEMEGKRDEVQRYVERLGGRATSSVSGETDYVVAGSGAGSKLDQARHRDIPVMDEEAFIEFVEKQQ